MTQRKHRMKPFSEILAKIKELRNSKVKNYILDYYWNSPWTFSRMMKVAELVENRAPDPSIKKEVGMFLDSLYELKKQNYALRQLNSVKNKLFNAYPSLSKYENMNMLDK